MIGNCLCGEVEFNMTGAIPYQCHCSQCRKQGGVSSNTAMIVNENQFFWRSGQHVVVKFKHKTGFNSHFCSVCGSPVPNKLGAKDLIWIPVGLLEDNESLEIVAHLHVGSKASWETISNSGTHYEEMPSIEALIQAMQQTSR